MRNLSKNSALIVAGQLLMIGSVGFILFSIIGHYDEIPGFELNIFSIGALLLAAAVAVLANTIAAFAWGRLVAVNAGALKNPRHSFETASKPKNSSGSMAFPTAFRIWALANVAKYLPGNVFQYAGRFALARKSGVRGESILISMGLEVFFLCIAAASVVIFGYLSGFLDLVKVQNAIGLSSFSGRLIIAVIVISGLIGAACLFRGFRKRMSQDLSRVGIFAALCAFGGYTISFLAMGWSAVVLLDALWRFDGGIGWLGLSSGYALAFLAGYVVPGAPGGIGIREVVLVALFETTIGTGLVLGLAVLLRILSTFADFVCFAVAMTIREP